MTIKSCTAELSRKYGPWLSVQQLAQEAGIAPRTLRHYGSNGYAPQAQRKWGPTGLYPVEVAALWLEDRAACRREHPDLYVKRVSP